MGPDEDKDSGGRGCADEPESDAAAGAEVADGEDGGAGCEGTEREGDERAKVVERVRLAAVAEFE